MLDKLINYALALVFFESLAFIIAFALIALSPVKGALVIGAVMASFVGLCTWANNEK